MSKLAGTVGTTGVAVTGAAAAGAVAVALYVSGTFDPEPTVVPEPVVAVVPQTSAPETATTPEPAVEVAVIPEPEPQEPPAVYVPSPPSFDVVRVEADGATLVAGLAEAGSEIAVLLDGAEQSRAKADNNGRFVSFLDLGASDLPRVLTLRMFAGELVLDSEDQVILSPNPAVVEEPVEMAALPPEVVEDPVETVEAESVAEVEAEPVAEVDPVETVAEVEPVETVAEVEPVETVAEVDPVETVAEVEPVETVAEVEPVETVAEVEPAETVAEVEPVEMVAEVELVEMVAEVEPVETVAEVEPVETVAEVEPVETVAEVEPVETVAEVAPVETVAEVEPVETVAEVEPVETVAEVEPVEAVAEVEPVETVVEAEPVETVAEVEPVETVAEVEPVEAVAEVEPVETVAEVEPVETVAEVAPVETVAEVEPVEAVAKVEPVETVTEVEPVEAVAEVEPVETVAEVEPVEVVVEAAPTPKISDVAPDVSADNPQVVGASPKTETTSLALTEPKLASVPERATPVAPTVILANREGVRVLQAPTAAPEVVTTIALDAITYDPSGEVALSGRGTDTDFVRVYLNNKPIVTSRIADDGSWKANLPTVDTGIYTLRVDQVAEDGKVISRVETPFKREDPAVIAASDQLNDSNSSTIRVVTVQPGNTLWAIARDRYGEGIAYVRVFEANRDRIRNPDLIYPGQVFDIPN